MIDRTGVVPGAGSQSGIGAIVQSLFFSPKAPTANGLIWGVGPVIAFPTIEDGLGSEDWGLGLTAVALKTNGPWTMGMLGNHVWSVTDNDDMEDYSNTFLQPFLTYTTAASTTFALNLESTYDWKNEQWSIPVNANVSQLIRVAGHPVSIGAGVRYWAEAPENGPENWGARLTVTYLFPK